MQINNSKKSAKRGILLGWFILFSVLAHGLFLTISGDNPDNNLYVSLSSPLQVTVVSSTSASSSNQAIAVEEEAATSLQKYAAATKAIALPQSVKTTGKSDTGNSNNASSGAPETVTLNRHNPVKTSVNRTSTQTFTEAPKSNSATARVKNVPLNHLRQQLKETIKARFTYPRMARRMGWEGLVGLSLHIENDGSLNTIRIARSSGHKILDENARKTIQGIGRIQVASNLQIQPVDTEIEVLYRLAD
jgi:TonB family protein